MLRSFGPFCFRVLLFGLWYKIPGEPAPLLTLLFTVHVKYQESKSGPLSLYLSNQSELSPGLDFSLCMFESSASLSLGREISLGDKRG